MCCGGGCYLATQRSGCFAFQGGQGGHGFLGEDPINESHPIFFFWGGMVLKSLFGTLQTLQTLLNRPNWMLVATRAAV